MGMGGLRRLVWIGGRIIKLGGEEVGEEQGVGGGEKEKEELDMRYARYVV
jgi:hypothetical protein